jgi:hypothetical protein
LVKEQKSAEVIVSRKRASKKNEEVSQKEEGLNVRMGEAIRTFMVKATTTETRQRTTLREDRP